MKALAIDDDLEFLKILEVHLKTLSYTTTAIHNVERILRAITQETYDLVLVDWMMPEVDGITIIKNIRARDRQTNHDTQVIMVTAINNPMARAYAKKSGADGFLAKSENSANFRNLLFEMVQNTMNEPAHG
jgi:DNA-binding response OmpR family regulator